MLLIYQNLPVSGLSKQQKSHGGAADAADRRGLVWLCYFMPCRKE
jgi:hypothetical protein